MMIDEEFSSLLGHLKEGRRLDWIRGVMAYFNFGLKEAYDVDRASRGEDVFLSSAQKRAVKKIKNARC